MREVILVLMLSSQAWAHEGHHAAKPKRLVGEVIDITCFVDHDGSGEKHAACAQKCIAAGNPVGLLVGDVVYLVVLGSHEPPGGRLAEFAGRKVVATGRVMVRNGLHILDLDTVNLIVEKDEPPKRET
jgi:hypothetical protein